MEALFRNRQDAGRQLAAELVNRYGGPDLRILALPRGGVPVAYEVAGVLQAPLDVLTIRKLGLPQHQEFAMGAIASGNVTVLDQDVIRGMGVSQQSLDATIAAEQKELIRREKAYRGDLPPLDIAGRIIIIVDDGLATGATMRAAVAAVRQARPRCIVAAVPVAAADTCAMIRSEAEEVICLAEPEPFHAVGLWYEHFPQTTDQEVQDLLARARPPASP